MVKVKLIGLKRKQGIAYYCEVYSDRNKRNRIRCTYKGMPLWKEKEDHHALAKRFVLEKQKELNLDGLTVHQILNNQTPFLPFARIFEESKHNLGTRAKYKQATDNLIACFNSTITFQEIDFNKVQQYKNYLFKKGYAHNTVYKRINYVKTIYNAAMADGLIKTKRNPFLSAGITEMDTVPVYLEIDELQAIRDLNLDDYISKLTKRNQRDSKIKEARVWFLSQCYLGLRVSDMKTFNQHLSRDMKKVEFVHKKTGRSTSIPVSENVIELIRDYEFKLPEISEQKINKNLKVISDLAGLNKKLTTHVAKHTFISILANNDVNIETIASLLNQSARVIRRVYLHVYEKTKLEAINKMPKLGS